MCKPRSVGREVQPRRHSSPAVDPLGSPPPQDGRAAPSEIRAAQGRCRLRLPMGNRAADPEGSARPEAPGGTAP